MRNESRDRAYAGLQDLKQLLSQDLHGFYSSVYFFGGSSLSVSSSVSFSFSP